MAAKVHLRFMLLDCAEVWRLIGVGEISFYYVEKFPSKLAGRNRQAEVLNLTSGFDVIAHTFKFSSILL